MVFVHLVATQHSAPEPRLLVCHVLQDRFVWPVANVLRVTGCVPKAVFQCLEVASARLAALVQLELSTQSLLRSHQRRVPLAPEELIASPVARKPMAMESVLQAVCLSQAAAKLRCAILALPDATVCKDAPRARAVDFVQLEHSLRRAQVLITAAHRAPRILILTPLVLQDACRVTLQMGGMRFRNLQSVIYRSIHVILWIALLLLLLKAKIGNTAGTDIPFGCMRAKA